MKNNRQEKDVIFSVEYNELHNGNSEIVDDKYVVYRATEQIKKKVFVALDLTLFDKYMATNPTDRIAFLKENWDFIPN